jgi:single-strand DNA-binding protein
MTEQISVAGLVATMPRHLVTADGLPVTSFRLVAANRKYDKNTRRWIEADSNWFTVSSFRQLAVNTSGSINKGDRVVVTGRLKIREWDNGDKSGTSVEIEADAIGHDLSWGTANFTRTTITKDLDPEEEEEKELVPA